MFGNTLNINASVGIIIPCYNCTDYISSTLECLINQTYKNIEIICIDDGSKDDTLSVLKSYENKYKFIKVFHQENSGVSSARNKGISICTTDYIMFLDSDDQFSINCIESLVIAAENNKSNISYCKLTSNIKEIEYSDEYPIEIQDQKLAMENLLYKLGLFGFTCYIYKTSLLKKYGLRFDEDIHYGEDRSFVWKYLCHFDSVSFVNAYLYWYRDNKKSATKKRKQFWNRTDSLTAVKRTTHYLNENGCFFSDEYDTYMFSRDMWAVCKAFAISSEKELYKKLINQYNVKKCMVVTSKDRRIAVRIASRIFLINPMLFYYLIKIIGLFV